MQAIVVDFIENGLTDPRVAAEIFPFDRPTLASEMAPHSLKLMSLNVGELGWTSERADTVSEVIIGEDADIVGRTDDIDVISAYSSCAKYGHAQCHLCPLLTLHYWHFRVSASVAGADCSAVTGHIEDDRFVASGIRHRRGRRPRRSPMARSACHAYLR